jgi:hypothetical protein
MPSTGPQGLGFWIAFESAVAAGPKSEDLAARSIAASR